MKGCSCASKTHLAVYRGVHDYQGEGKKKYIAERNAHEGAAGSGSGETAVPSTPVTETLADDGTGTPTEDAAQDGVTN